jgi:integrase/recombinase XerD
VPETGLLAALRRPHPYLFSPAQLGQLLEAVSRLGPRGSLRPHTYYALIGLLASTGLRVGEALRLSVADVRLDDDPPHLRIVQTKFGKSRLVPLHPSSAQKLRDYAQLRRRLGYHALGEVFFLSETGQALDYSVLWRTFARLTRRLGLWPVEGRRPSLHALRHTFAVERLVSWYRAGVDVRALAPSLSVYLGHVHPEESYWYFTATPELLEAAAHLFERYAERGGS